MGPCILRAREFVSFDGHLYSIVARKDEHIAEQPRDAPVTNTNVWIERMAGTFYLLALLKRTSSNRYYTGLRLHLGGGGLFHKFEITPGGAAEAFDGSPACLRVLSSCKSSFDLKNG